MDVERQKEKNISRKLLATGIMLAGIAVTVVAEF